MKTTIKSKQMCLIGLAVIAAGWLALPAQAVVFTDSFSYPDGGLVPNDPNWIRRGDKTQHAITSGTIASEVPGVGVVSGNWYDGAMQVAENYQRASIEFQIDSGFVDYGGQLHIALNQDFVASGYYLRDNSYRLLVRGRNDFAVLKNVGGADVLGGYYSFTPATPLAYETWYRATIIRSNDVITGSVTSLDGLTTYGIASFTDSGTPFNGGRVGLGSFFQNEPTALYRFDNFQYELLSIVPEPSTVGLLSLGGLLILCRRKGNAKRSPAHRSQ